MNATPFYDDARCLFTMVINMIQRSVSRKVQLYAKPRRLYANQGMVNDTDATATIIKSPFIDRADAKIANTIKLLNKLNLDV